MRPHLELELALDEPFEDHLPFHLMVMKLNERDIIEVEDLPCLVTTPLGTEIVMKEVFDEDTKVYNMVELAALISDSCPHRHTTVRSLHAVGPL
jgi:hypothetical protein